MGGEALFFRLYNGNLIVDEGIEQAGLNKFQCALGVFAGIGRVRLRAV